ncbi:MAG TPA: sigma-70 family RNA polymerase sigma factor [Vicinamibacterales bacterium]|nr:sigma-70 family RNA polymerase sigma factor [Vicinamibacterales bacterium]
MRADSTEQVTRLLAEASAGKREALEALLPLVYDELRRRAAAYMKHERPGQTLQATALVHEAYLRLMKEPNTRWQNRAHFCAIAANSMRQILVERARARGRVKRAGNQQRITLSDTLAAPEPPDAVDVEELDAALTRLAQLDAELARLVELRFFGGLSIEETAEVLGISAATVKRRWATARAWLKREMRGAQGAGGSE